MKINIHELQLIQKIIDKLDDEESKELFIFRLLYSLTNDIRYVYDMMGKPARKNRGEIIRKSEEVQKIYKLYKKCDLYSWLLKHIHQSDENIVIFGGGTLGKNILYWLRSIGFPPKAICDNDLKKIGTHIDECPVVSVETLEKEYNNSIVIIATYTYSDEMKQQLSKLNISQELIYEYEDNSLLSAWEGSYFEEGIFKLREHEIFVDAGAYHGETTEEFASWCPSYEKIYCFEPDSSNYVKLTDNLQGAMRDVTLIKAGLWNENKRLYFESVDRDRTASHINDQGTEEIDVVSLDSILNGDRVTYIKMDIEGAELEALEGARETIRKYKPKLAICLYHKPEDIISLPAYIMELVPEYRFKIRHYTTFFQETILYAYIEENSQ